MIAHLSALLLGGVALSSALPVVEKRTVTSLNEAAFEQAQQRDNTATRAFSSIEIKTSSGQCLFVDELSGDFRANLTPVQVADCDGSTGQLWDIITAGKHNNVPGTMLVVSTLTQACLNFDPRRAAGDQVILSSCGGRGDGSGQVTNSQLFSFSGGAGPLALEATNKVDTCMTIINNVLQNTACNKADPNQSFTFDGSGSSSNSDSISTSATVAAACPTSAPAVAAAVDTDTDTADPVTVTVDNTITVDNTVTVTVTADAATAAAATTTSASIAAVTAAAADPANTSAAAAVTTTAAATDASGIGSILTFNPTTPVPVSRAGGVLQPSAAAEANHRDDTAVRALSSISLKSADGQCLFIDPTAGDFRENLIPINLKPCEGLPNEKFDIITSGVHNNVAGQVLIVSSLVQGCLNFDNRRAAGDTVILFSCGGRGDGTGQVTNSQLFAFTAGETSLRLVPQNGNGQVCLVPNSSGRLDQATCSTDPSQLFTIEQ